MEGHREARHQILLLLLLFFCYCSSRNLMSFEWFECYHISFGKCHPRKMKMAIFSTFIADTSIHGNQINIISFSCPMSSTPISNQYNTIFFRIYLESNKNSSTVDHFHSGGLSPRPLSDCLRVPPHTKADSKSPIFHQIKCAFVKIDKAGFIVVLLQYVWILFLYINNNI